MFVEVRFFRSVSLRPVGTSSEGKVRLFGRVSRRFTCNDGRKAAPLQGLVVD